MKQRSRQLFIHGTFLFILLLLSACAAPSNTQPAQPSSSQEASSPAAASEEKVAAKDFTVKLAANPWTASGLNVHIAKILLEEKLGYKVEIVDIDENAQWPALATGDLHASLEVWPSGHANNVKTYIDEQKVVENIGTLGVEGKIGWFIPTYLLKDHPELATWEGFQTPENAALFKTAETGDAGQFLGGDASWVQYDEQIIANLGLNLKVVYAGSEEAILAAVDAAYSRNDPVLIYFYRPHSAFAKYDLTNVKLPEHTAECYSEENIKAGKVNCDYPTDILFKVAWKGLQEAAPEAYNLLAKMNYSTETQIGLIASVDAQGQKPEEAARAWIDANEAEWSKWIQ